MVDNALYEEEMIRLAEEMSLQERKDQESYEYKWDPNNLDAVRMKLRVYEEILDGIDCATPEFQNEDGAPVMTDDELREMFFSAGVSEEEIRLSSASVGLGRSSGRKDQKTHDTVAMICRGLTWYRNKLVDEIQSSHEVRNAWRLSFCLCVCNDDANVAGGGRAARGPDGAAGHAGVRQHPPRARRRHRL